MMIDPDSMTTSRGGIVEDANHALDLAIACIVSALRSGGTLYACGNGGSHAHADHLVAELVGRFAYDRPPLRAVLLSSGGAVGSCIANDYGWDQVFARQVRALCKRHVDPEGDDAHDVLVVFSTSGQSRNVLNAVREANRNRAPTVALVGQRGLGVVDETRVVDFLQVRADGDTPTVQETHQRWVHEIARRVEEALCPR